jgi:phenylpropionate dioxygenase-like ring-hydroxylating dioxygenase large terminal subunit
LTHPLSRNPIGWFAVGRSTDVGVGASLAVDAHGKELVLFRTASGQVGLLDAYCPHLGTHLGHGGTVDGECVRCPFHRWAFGTDGACTDIPYAKKVPPNARTPAYEVRERNGVILAWFHPESAPPSFDIPEFEAGIWSEPAWLDLVYDVHIQEIAENGVDIAHFMPIHGCGRSSVEMIDAKGHPFQFILRTSYDGDGIGAPGRFVDVTSHWSFHGPGLFHSISTADDIGTRVRHIFHFTPIPGDRVHFRVATSVDMTTIPAGMKDFVLRRNAEITRANLDQDAPIWRRKRYNIRPVLSAGDGPVALLRRWTRKFYPALEAPELGQAERGRYELERLPELSTIQEKRRAEHVPELQVSEESLRLVFEEKLLADFRAGVAAHPFVVQYEVTGEVPAAWHLEVEPAACRSVRGTHESPEVTVTVDVRDWLGIHSGRLDPVTAFMTGKLAIAGNMDLAVKLGDIFPLAPRVDTA